MEIAGFTGEGDSGGEETGADGGDGADGVQGAHGDQGAYGEETQGELGTKATHAGGGGEKHKEGFPSAMATAAANASAWEPPTAVADA